METDYNLHKSNSTYFSDLDISRMHHVACLMKRGLHKAHYNPAKNADGTKKGKFGVMLGGVTCSFKNEIKPYEAYEIWTRVLSWDKKWLYLLSHIVKKGAVMPKGYTLQPQKKMGKGSMQSPAAASTNGNVNGAAAPPQVPHPAIFATSIAKYVFKEGRITIPPELALEASELLPPRPTGYQSPPMTDSPAGEGSAIETAVVDAIGSLEQGEKLESKAEADEGVWDWERVEKERARGMLTAQHMADLDQLQFEFTGDKTPALGRY
ncbi:MAG: acyl-CoA thioesterase [Janthinobacterium lividum]